MVSKLDVIRIPLGDTGFTEPGTMFDQRRTRTAWFEGQHVTADQFNRDQSYHLTRQSDLGRTIGQGVVEGLRVAAKESSATALSINSGLGLAPSGEVIHLPDDVELDLADIPTQRRLNALLEARGGAKAPLETRTGLYVLAASTVEYASNPVGSYPVSATSSRTLEDSIINEAVLFTLTPYPVAISNVSTDTWQRAAAYRIFIEAKDPELPAGALPLAMVALSGNRIVWIDVPMVRRSCAPASGDIFGLGLVDQTRRVAHFEQFDTMIDPIIAGNSGNGLAASTLVDALPPMGRLPVASVAMRGVSDLPERLSQNWLPASVPCELVAVPEDEVEALLRESVHLPPIDLGAGDKVLANTPVSIIVPVPRAEWMTTPGEVLETTLPLTPPPAVGGAPTDPSALLDELINGSPAPLPSDSALTAQWRALLGQANELWYARRRQFQRSDDTVTGIVDERIPTPVEVTDATDAPVDPVVVSPERKSLDPAPLIDMLSPGLRALHAQLKLEGAFKELLEFDPADLLPVLIRQQQAVAVGGYTAIGAMTLGLVQFGGDAKEIVSALEPDVISAVTDIEPVILGTGLTVLLQPSKDSNVQSLQTMAQKFSPLGPSTIGNAIRSHAPVPLQDQSFQNAEDLKGVLSAIVESKTALQFETRPPFGDEVLAARMVLMSSKLFPTLAQALAAISREKWSEALLSLRSTFVLGQDPDKVTEALIEKAKGFA
ncbi:MAG: hypothetical protein ABJL99_03395 [Aliishimia sp.]